MAATHLTAPETFEALRLPALYRAVLTYAGVPAVPEEATDRFLVRVGSEPPGLFAALLEEAVLDDRAEATACVSKSTSHVAIRPGFREPCPLADTLKRAVRPSGDGVLLFAVERRDAAGCLRDVTWAAMPEEEPTPAGPFRAVVIRQDVANPDEP